MKPTNTQVAEQSFSLGLSKNTLRKWEYQQKDVIFTESTGEANTVQVLFYFFYQYTVLDTTNKPTVPW